MERPREPEADLRPVEGAEADVDLAALSKALGHPARVRIVRLLRAREGQSVGELVEELGYAQSTVSEHLRLLRDAGVVFLDADGARGDYVVDIHRLRRLKALVGSL
jgi:ArsR family transcriptional regulator